MDEIYNDYLLEGELISDNSGFARWGFAKKDGDDFFLKEFLSPAYPVDKELFSEKQYEKKKENCTRFEEEKVALYRKINIASDGNAQRIMEFFRCGSKYYIVMKKLISLNYMPENVAKMEYQQKILFCKVLAHSIMRLHENGVIHADIKWDNLIFVQSEGSKKPTVKLIDFDNSFLENNAPVIADGLNLDQVYCSPETFWFLNEEDIKLTAKIDVYALGIIFHQIFAGSIPKIDDKYQYVYEAQIDNSNVELSSKLPKPIFELVTYMINKDPEKRITSSTVFYRLNNLGKDEKEDKKDAITSIKTESTKDEEKGKGKEQNKTSEKKEYFHPAGDL